MLQSQQRESLQQQVQPNPIMNTVNSKSSNRFKIRAGKKNTSFPKSVMNQPKLSKTSNVQIDQDVLETFYNTTVQHKSLRKKRRPAKKGIFKMKTASERLDEIMNSKVDFKEGFETEQQKLNKLKEEVRALPNILKPNPNPRTYNMILEQKRRRRMEHINEMHDFEKDIQNFKEIQQQKIDNLKKEVENYESNMNDMIEQYMDNLSPEHLLQREEDIVQEIGDFNQSIKTRMLVKLENIDSDLDQFEDEFYDSIQSNVENLEEALIDIAFKLQPEIKETIEKIRQGFKGDIESNKASNKEYYETAKKRIEDKIKQVQTMCDEKIALWRKIKHDAVMKEFSEHILIESFQDPKERKECLCALENYMRECFEERRKKILILENMPSSELSKARLENYLEQVTEINDKANEGYDVYVEKLIGLKKATLASVRDYIEHVKFQIKHYNADLGETTHENVFETVLEPEYTKIEENQTQVIQSVIDFMEERDKIQNYVCQNLGHSMLPFGKRMEKYIIDHTQTEKKFEYEKAVLEDENEDKLVELTKNLDEAKMKLRRSKHHPILDENLQHCFKCVDDIDAEFRSFHEKNQEVISKHAPLIEEMFDNLENDFANLMELRSLTERETLEQRAVLITRWKAKLATDKHIEEEKEKAARELAELIEKNKDNKKFKPPKVKPKNEKQLKQEWDALFQEYSEKLKVTVVQIDDIGTGNARLIDRSVEAFTRSLYQPSKEPLTEEEEEELRKKQEEEERLEQERKQKELEEQANSKKKGKKKNVEEEVFEEKTDPEDIHLYEMEHAIPQFEKGQEIFSSEFTFEYPEILEIVKIFRNKIFDFLARKKLECLSEAETSDKDFIQMSLHLLDERIKSYYSMKGTIQTEIYLIRGGEITQHKNRYQLYVKRVLDEIDDQTDRFNFFYQEIFDSKASHTEQMKKLQDSLPEQSALTNLMGVRSQAQEADLKFRELCNATFEKMGVLATTDLDRLQIGNGKMIESCKLIEEGGNYGQEEIEWYREQMKEIDEKIEEHKVKRAENLEKIKALCSKRQIEALEKFKEKYASSMEELTARDATGKVFGKPKREGQKIVRNEFTICQKVQNQLQTELNTFKEYIKEGYVGSLTVRQQLMTFRACSYFYGQYLEAFIEETPLEVHPRVSYDESIFRVLLEEGEDPDDDERQENELKPLQRLYYRGDDVKFNQKISEMENAIKDETAKLYTGEYSKLLGPDKLTDVLRDFLENLKQEMVDFRIESIRQLRIITDQFIELVPQLNKVIMNSIFNQDRGKLDQESSHRLSLFEKSNEQNNEVKEDHIRDLRPNLNHPDNKEDLTQLNAAETERKHNQKVSTEKFQEEYSQLYFEESNKYFVRVLNNISFLLTYYDNFILHEDYIELPGDENTVKKHLNLKKLMIMQQKGELTDTSSWRSLRKAWKTYDLNTFQYKELKFDFSHAEGESNEASTAKKGGKKKAPAKKGAKKGKDKKGKKGVEKGEVSAEREEGKTIPIVSYKTVMHKSAYSCFDVNLTEFKRRFDSELKAMEDKIDHLDKEELQFEFYWQLTNKRLFDDDI